MRQMLEVVLTSCCADQRKAEGSDVVPPREPEEEDAGARVHDEAAADGDQYPQGGERPQDGGGVGGQQAAQGEGADGQREDRPVAQAGQESPRQRTEKAGQAVGYGTHPTCRWARM